MQARQARQASEVGAMPMTLREAREAARLTRELLAAKTGNVVTASTIYRIEQDQSSAMPAVRAALAQALGVPVTEILWPERKSRE